MAKNTYVEGVLVGARRFEWSAKEGGNGQPARAGGSSMTLWVGDPDPSSFGSDDPVKIDVFGDQAAIFHRAAAAGFGAAISVRCETWARDKYVEGIKAVELVSIEPFGATLNGSTGPASVTATA